MKMPPFSVPKLNESTPSQPKADESTHIPTQIPPPPPYAPDLRDRFTEPDMLSGVITTSYEIAPSFICYIYKSLSLFIITKKVICVLL